MSTTFEERREEFRQKCKHLIPRIDCMRHDFCSNVPCSKQKRGVLLVECEAKCQRMKEWEKRNGKV